MCVAATLMAVEYPYDPGDHAYEVAASAEGPASADIYIDHTNKVAIWEF